MMLIRYQKRNPPPEQVKDERFRYIINCQRRVTEDCLSRIRVHLPPLETNQTNSDNFGKQTCSKNWKQIGRLGDHKDCDVDKACLTTGLNHNSYDVKGAMNPPVREEKNIIIHMNSLIQIILLGLVRSQPSRRVRVMDRMEYRKHLDESS
ncbi:hypothetical protein F2P81_014082 [Scophthalmus maximus]|uniref:Uncharacterized protein n=1 Tax=Scophthalmus maximus TaxID=52904 RepID=A0A6A4SFT9_SCOMX|nr:hypothetical protein F2P81_014082 [Scophthalmus maximus]